jgi:hypothetical protein
MGVVKMRLKLIINHIIDGRDKDSICSIIPNEQLKDSFRQRKCYHEYYFTETWIEICEQTLMELANEYKLILQGDYLYIEFYI